MTVAKLFTRLRVVVKGSCEETKERWEASGPALTCRVREYSARNWCTERIRISDAEEVGFRSES